MGRHDVAGLEPESIRTFTRCILEDLRALEYMLKHDMFESGTRRFGAEQELFLVDRAWRPAPIALEVLEQLESPEYTTELARFNMEFNLEPFKLDGYCFSCLERQLAEKISQIRDVARIEAATVVLTGILPTLSKSDLALDNITPLARYHALNEAMTRMRGGPMRLRIEGTDELHLEHDSVMLEACNTSFQIHLQTDADEFVDMYNLAQAITGPVLSACVNSPMLFGRRLWAETRIALFQQSVDTRRASTHMRELSPRVRFGERWIRDSVLDAFQEDVARFRVLMAGTCPNNPFEILEAGGIPELRALQLHNSTVYRWNRPCFGIYEGKPHLRIECRTLPAGPSVLDEVANATFWVGLMLGARDTWGDVTRRLDFDDAKSNFLAAARHGLKAGFTWLDGTPVSATDLILEEMLPVATHGLKGIGVSDGEIDRYLGVIRERVSSRRTGANWLQDSWFAMRDRGARAERMAALTAATHERQLSGAPVHSWDLARLEEAGGWGQSYELVEQIMTTDLFTVGVDELVDLAAFLMDRKQIRHVLVEGDNHTLAGIVSYRSIIRLIADAGPEAARSTIPVSEIMETNPITVHPRTKTIEAIELMRRSRVSVLPVVDDGRLVGVISERDFMGIAGELLDERLREECSDRGVL